MSHSSVVCSATRNRHPAVDRSKVVNYLGIFGSRGNLLSRRVQVPVLQLHSALVDLAMPMLRKRGSVTASSLPDSLPFHEDIKSLKQLSRVNVPVTDTCSYEHHLTLDIHGFQLARQPTRLHGEDFDSPSTVENEYYPEVEAYLRILLGAEDVRVMQSATRERPLGFLETGGEGVVRGDRRERLPGLHIGRCLH